MKDKIQIFGIITMTVIIMLSMIACKGKDSSSVANGQEDKNSYNPDLPIAYWNMLGLPPIKINKLFINDNFEEGMFKTVCESTSIKNDTFTGILLSKANGQDALRITVSIKSDTTTGFNYITEIIIGNLMTGQKDTLIYDGSERSAGKVIGALYELMKLLYDIEKLL